MESVNISLKRKYEEINENFENQKKNNSESNFCEPIFINITKDSVCLWDITRGGDTNPSDATALDIFSYLGQISPWEFRRLKADLSESEAQRIKLEDRIDQLHKNNKEAVIFFDKEKNEMKSQLEFNRNTIKDLEFRLNKVRKREMECREELNEKIKINELLKQKYKGKIFYLENENKELSIKVSQMESAEEDKVKKIREEMRHLKEENEKLKLEIDEKKDHYITLSSKLTTANSSLKDYEDIQNQLHLAHLKIKDLQSEKEEFEEAKSITVTLSEKVLRVTELEKELHEKKLQIANLKQFVHNNVMLEEIINDLKVKLASIQDKEKEIPFLKAKVVELEMEIEKWTAIAVDFSNGCTRESLSSYIESLQKKEVSSKIEMNNLNTKIKSSEKALITLQNELESIKARNQKLEMALQRSKVEVQLLRKKSILVSRERDSYRQQLDLYERDLTVTGFYVENPINEITSHMKNKIQNLETSLEEYRKYIEDLEAQLKIYRNDDSLEYVEVISKLKEELKDLEESNKILLQKRDELEQKLEIKILKSDNLTTTKILHFRNNPTFEAEKNIELEINTLREECEKLRSRVKLLESGDSLNVTQKVVENVKTLNSQKVLDLEKELQSANLKIQRLKEVFKKTSQEFRDVSYMLLGYRIDLVSNDKLYKLYNMYSTSSSDYLMFQQTKSGSMEMLGTSFAESMSKLVDEYLHKGNSIPAFLSAITLELFGLGAQSEEEDDDTGIKKKNDPPTPIDLE